MCPLSALGAHLVQPHAGSVHAATVSVSSSVCSPVESRRPSLHLLCSYAISVPSSKEFCPEERDLMRDVSFGPECSSIFHFLHIVCLWVYVFVYICCRKKKSYSNNGWARHGSMSTAECHLESCIAMFISQSSSAWFSPRPLACLVSDSWLPKQNWVWLLSHEVGLSSN